MDQTEDTAYHPARLLDAVMQHRHLNNDNELSRLLRVAPAVLHKIRMGRMPVAASMFLWIAEVTGMSVGEMRRLLGDRRRTCRLNVSWQRRSSESKAHATATGVTTLNKSATTSLEEPRSD